MYCKTTIFGFLALLSIFALPAVSAASDSEMAKTSESLPYDVYSGYFVSNKYEPDEAASYLAIDSQEQFDTIFGIAMVMNDSSHRLPEDLFKTHIVLSIIRRGPVVWEYQVKEVTLDDGVVTLHYVSDSNPTSLATFTCPLIVSIPKGNYKIVRFIDDKTVEKTLDFQANHAK